MLLTGSWRNWLLALDTIPAARRAVVREGRWVGEVEFEHGDVTARD